VHVRFTEQELASLTTLLETINSQYPLELKLSTLVYQLALANANDLQQNDLSYQHVQFKYKQFNAVLNDVKVTRGYDQSQENKPNGRFFSFISHIMHCLLLG